MVGPILLVATLVALQWSSKPVLSGDGPFLAGFVFIFRSITLAYYQAGRPDHHSLIILVFVLSIGLTLRMILRPLSARLCYVAGILCAFSVWISVESMLTTCLAVGALGLFWVLERGDFLEKSLHLAVALFLATGLSIVLERAPPNLLAVEYDRLSIVHFSIFGLVTVVWIALFVLNDRTRLFRTRTSRLLSVLVCAALLALAVHLFFPKFYKGPFVDLDPRLMSVWFSKIGETRPLICETGTLATPVQLVGSALVAFPFLLYLLRKDARSENRKGWLYLLFSSIFFIPFSIYCVRLSAYLQIFLIIPLAQLMVLMRGQGSVAGPLKTTKNVLILMAFTVGILSAGVLTDIVLAEKGDSPKSCEKAHLIPMCDYLAQAEEWGGQELLILTHVDFCAEILYRTEHEVLCTQQVSGTSSRKGQGLWDTYETMTATDDESAREIIQRRRIDLILLCPKSTESIFYSRPEVESTFYQRLLQDRVPYWLRRAELPDELASSFQLFEVVEK